MSVGRRLTATLVLSLTFAAPADAGQRPEPPRHDIASALLRDASGAERGRAVFYQRGQEVRIEVAFTGAAPGEIHGVHLHRIGQCDGPDFASAGEHWNPHGVDHGMDNPWGGHAGDLPNLRTGADGVARIDHIIDGVALTEGRPPLVGMGAIVVHADPDDMITDPAGNSGARIACGAFGG